MSKPKNTVLSERKSWLLFWEYHLPRISYEQFGKGKKGGLPKDPFELAIYKMCELKFNTERFTSKYAKEYVTHYIGLPLEERAKMGMH